ncbi:uncharacterized protein LOC110832307 [Zootermopsis nevadensis]|uniref:uncharacterized protein LOC110832307 n=1 Tax=Zootermopsis nevadensis TaxID=136037 RepID=UPI000B8EAD70|nr:uncharacterized protein LOC110832307 [Zootermopsis nevadensis]
MMLFPSHGSAPSVQVPYKCPHGVNKEDRPRDVVPGEVRPPGPAFLRRQPCGLESRWSRAPRCDCTQRWGGGPNVAWPVVPKCHNIFIRDNHQEFPHVLGPANQTNLTKIKLVDQYGKKEGKGNN